MKKGSLFYILLIMAALTFCGFTTVRTKPLESIDLSELTVDLFAEDEAPYIDVYSQYEDGSNHHTEVYIWYYVPKSVMRITEVYNRCMENSEEGEAAFDSVFGVSGGIDVFVQMDVRFNDEPWLSETEEWNKQINAINEGNGLRAFCVMKKESLNRTRTMASMEQTVFSAYSSVAPEYAFLKDYVKIAQNAGGGVAYQYALSTNTISYRYRYVLNYRFKGKSYNDREHETIVGAWSKVASIGAGVNSKQLSEPAAPGLPILSDYAFSNEDGKRCCTFNLRYSDAVMRELLYYRIYEFTDNPYTPEFQIKINNYAWLDIKPVAAEPYDIRYNTYHYTADLSHTTVTKDADVLIRVRLKDENGFYSEWSNMIGTAEGAINAPSATPTPVVIEGVVTEKADKCPICGICPVQPLGLCMFIWIAIAMLLTVVIVIAVKKKKRENREDNEWIENHNARLQEQLSREPEPFEEQTDESSDELTEEQVEEQSDEPTEEQTEEQSEELTDEATEEQTEEQSDKPYDESKEKQDDAQSKYKED